MAMLTMMWLDRKSTRLNSSHSQISYAVFCLKYRAHRDLHSFPTRRSSDLADAHGMTIVADRARADDDGVGAFAQHVHQATVVLTPERKTLAAVAVDPAIHADGHVNDDVAAAARRHFTARSGTPCGTARRRRESAAPAWPRTRCECCR